MDKRATRPQKSGREAAKRLSLIFMLLAAWICSAVAQTPRTPVYHGEGRDGPLTASIITCWPGSEIYELCGHAALRIRGEGMDSVWNYGVFDFREPNFLYRFVSGQTDYMVAGYPFAWFMPEYIDRGSRVVEQDLNLTDAETRRLRELLRTEALPANRKYRYNYVKDNCATRLTDRVEDAVGGRITTEGTPRFGTYREEMRSYHRDYPWYQFGIDLALGSGLDGRIGVKEEMFVPVEMNQRLDSAVFSDGRRVVKATRVLNDGRPDATLPPTPWWRAPLFWSVMVFVAAVVMAVADYRRRRVSRWWYTLFYSALGLAGCLVAFLVFVSEHEATSPNLLLLWLNPLQLVIALCVWWRRTRAAAVAMSVCDVIITICMLIGWPMQPQSGNPAFFPLMAATLVSAAAYAIIAGTKSYNNIESVMPQATPSGEGRRRGRNVKTRKTRQ